MGSTFEEYGGRRIANGWKMRCPCHDDKRPSLVVYDSGAVKCFAGCESREVRTKLGLKLSHFAIEKRHNLLTAWWLVPPHCDDPEWPKLVAKAVLELATMYHFNPRVLERLLADGMPRMREQVIRLAREALRRLSDKN